MKKLLTVCFVIALLVFGFFGGRRPNPNPGCGYGTYGIPCNKPGCNEV